MSRLKPRGWLIINVIIVLLATLGKAATGVASWWSKSAHKPVRSLEVIPFKSWSNANVWYGPLIDVAANIAIFLPIGVALAWLGWRSGKVVRWALGASISIETLQWVLAAGHSDITDIIINTLGAWLGWQAVRLLPEAVVLWLMRAWLLLVACLLIYGAGFSLIGK